jgi:hypothetical protein
VVDGDLSQRLHERLGWLAEDRAKQMIAVQAALVEFSPLSAEQKLALWESRWAGVEAIRDERFPLRMSGEEMARFTGRLQTAV